MRIVGAKALATLVASIALVAACDRNSSPVSQYSYEAGYGMPNPQPGSPISDAGVAPIPSPNVPTPSAAPSPSPSAPAPSPGTPSPMPAPGSPTPSPTP
jgi:hypothetical protein